MIRTLLVGLLLFLGFAVAFAPATLVRNLVPADAGIELLDTSGTLWNGSGSLYLGGQGAGRISWSFRPVTLASASLGYHVRLEGPDHRFEGRVGVGFGSASVALGGNAAAAFANRWLAPYDIAISGDLGFDQVTAEVPHRLSAQQPGAADGSVSWAGGAVRYRLSGQHHAGELPALVAHLGEGLEAVIYPAGGQTPLLRAAVLPDGFVRIGVTQMLTRLLGNPWPGSHADHEVVLEVEEQLF